MGEKVRKNWNIQWIFFPFFCHPFLPFIFHLSFFKSIQLLNEKSDRLVVAADLEIIWRRFQWCHTYCTLFFYKNHIFSAQPGERDRDNYSQSTTMFLNFQKISGWCSYKLGSHKKCSCLSSKVSVLSCLTHFQSTVTLNWLIALSSTPPLYELAFESINCLQYTGSWLVGFNGFSIRPW